MTSTPPSPGPVSAFASPVSVPMRLTPLSSSQQSFTTYYSSNSNSQKLHHAPARLLLKTQEGRERLLRTIQHLLRMYVYLHSKSGTNPPSKTSSILITVFLISSTRKLLALVDLFHPLFGGYKPASSPLPSTSSIMASTPFEWMRLGIDGLSAPPFRKPSGIINLQAFLTILQLVDTLMDGLALLVRLAPTRNLRKYRFKLERVADTAWLASSLLALGVSEWESRSIWERGRKIRKNMLKEEAVQAQLTIVDEGELEELYYVMRTKRKALKYLRARLNWLKYEKPRLIADALFGVYDVTRLRYQGQRIRAYAGLISSVLGLTQILKTVE